MAVLALRHYVEGVVRREATLVGGEVRVGRLGQTTLPIQWSDPTHRSLGHLVPDIVVRRGRSVRIVDAKYKAHLAELDEVEGGPSYRPERIVMETHDRNGWLRGKTFVEHWLVRVQSKNLDEAGWSEYYRYSTAVTQGGKFAALVRTMPKDPRTDALSDLKVSHARGRLEVC